MKKNITKTILFISLLLNLSNCSSQSASELEDFILISQSSRGDRPGSSEEGDMTSDGRYVVFISSEPNLVPADTNGLDDIFLRDTKLNTTIRVNVNSSGDEAIGGYSEIPKISDDGRFVAFSSTATNLVPNDTNNQSDGFIKDLRTGNVIAITVDINGVLVSGGTAGISRNGRFVVFGSPSSNIVAGDTNTIADVFVKDLQTNTILTLTTDSNGMPLQIQYSFNIEGITDDGRFVLFGSNAPNLVPNDNTTSYDHFIKDLQNGTTIRVSENLAGQELIPASSSQDYSLTGDGRYLTFSSRATNLVQTDLNNISQIFVRDLQLGTISLVSTNVNGTYANQFNSNPILSANGRYLFFESNSNNLVDSDTNGFADCFIKDLQTGNIKRISVLENGTEFNDQCDLIDFSSDGQTAVFSSEANNIIKNDTNGMRDIFLKRVSF